MTSSLKARLGRLETHAGVAGRQWVLQVPHGMDIDEALQKLGITPADNDLIIVLASFAQLSEPTLIARPNGCQRLHRKPGNG